MTSVHSQRASTNPTLSEVVDGRRGRVTVSGHLTPQGADLVRGTVEGLRRLGHSTVVLDLKAVRVADPVGLHLLTDLCTSMADSGNRLLLHDVPRQTT